MKAKEERRELIQQVAHQIQDVMRECVPLILNIELLEETYNELSEKVSFMESGQPLFAALVGQPNLDKRQMETNLQRKRLKALLELVKTLSDTELERQSFIKAQKDQSSFLSKFGL